MRTYGILAAALLILACKKEEKEQTTIQTAPVERRDIVIDAEATGVVEPINVVEVKSKASGQITRMPVETGTQVKPGDLLVQVDTRDVKNQYDQSVADVRAAQAKLDVSSQQKKRSDELYGSRVITAQEYEAAQLDYANAQAQLVRSRASLDLAQQRLEDATVRAPVAGTVIEKTVSLGQVITSATGAFGGGTTLLKMADLSQVRVRALVNETDIGQLQPGQEATVTVDAYPERQFRGVVEKIEPQAVVNQSVTQFPVLVSIQNREGLLKPGMNGEVSVLIDRRDNVLAIPNDAVRNPREAMVTASALGLTPEQVQAAMQTALASRGGAPGAPPAAGGDTAPRMRVAGADGANAPRGAGGMEMPAVTPKQCEAVRATLAKNPAAQRKLDDLRTRMRSGELDRREAMTQSNAIYDSLALDGRVALGCRMQEMRGDADANGAGGGGPQVMMRTAQGGGAMAGGNGGGRGRTGIVFVSDSGRYTPKMVRLGASNYDYAEVVSGLQEGEQVALLAAAALQAQRQQSVERFRGMTGGGVPGMTRQQPAQGGAAAPGAAPAGGASGRADRQMRRQVGAP